MHTVHTFAIRCGSSPFPQWEKPPWGAEPRIRELWPALQQAYALPTELRRTRTELRRTLLSHAAPFVSSIFLTFLSSEFVFFQSYTFLSSLSSKFISFVSSALLSSLSSEFISFVSSTFLSSLSSEFISFVSSAFLSSLSPEFYKLCAF